MESSAAHVRSQLESDARAFAVEFQRALSQHVKQTLAQGIQEMASQIDESREGLHNESQALVRQFRSSLEPLGSAAIDEHKKRLDNASNAWLLTTVTKLTQQSEARIEELADATEKKLRVVCSQVISEMGATLRQRLGGLAAPIPSPGAPPATNDPSKDKK
jgi:exonuclease VII large subunit